jgi:quercetin dioxygenase-like cupin family protein
MSTTILATPAPGVGESFSLMGIRITTKITSAETGGHFSMVEEVAAPGAGSPPHVGNREDKIFYVVSGEFEILLGTAVHRLSAGDALLIPAGSVHRFQNVGETPGKLFVTFTPGGHEVYLRQMAALFQDEYVRREEIQSLSRTWGVEILDAA